MTLYYVEYSNSELQFQEKKEKPSLFYKLLNSNAVIKSLSKIK